MCFVYPYYGNILPICLLCAREFDGTFLPRCYLWGASSPYLGAQRAPNSKEESVSNESDLATLLWSGGYLEREEDM